MLYFGGTAYLGLQTNVNFQDIVIKNIKQWGTSYGSSRLANISLSAYEDCKIFLAKFIHSQVAVTVSSGMLAGKITSDELQKKILLFIILMTITKLSKCAKVYLFL